MLVKKRQMIMVIEYIMFLFPFFMPGGLTSLSGAENINISFHILKVVSIIIFLVLQRKIKISMNNRILLVVSLGLGISIADLLNTQNILSLRFAIFMPALYIMCVHMIKTDKKVFLLSIVLLFGGYNVIQALTVIKYYPNGINNYSGPYWKMTLAGAQYFMGAKNQMFSYMLLFLFSYFVYNFVIKQNEKWLKNMLIIILLFMLEAIRLDSANTLVCVALFGVFCLLSAWGINKRIRIIFNANIYIFLGSIAFVAICLLSQMSFMTIFSGFFDLIYHKIDTHT